MKKSFSLLELIFAIVVLGIIASFAIPKYMDTKNSAVISTIKRDILTVSTSVQSYYLINQKLNKISDAVTLHSKHWTIEDKKITFKDNNKNCLILELKNDTTGVYLDQSIIKNSGKICEKLSQSGVISTKTSLY